VVEERRFLMAARTRCLISVLIAFLIAGCGAASSSSPRTSLEPSIREPASEPVEPSSGICVLGSVCSGELPPGEYTSSSAGPIITFTLAGEGWSGAGDIQGEGFALFNDAVGGQHGISVVAYDGEVFTDVCSGGPTESIGATPSDLITFLAAVEGVHAEEPLETQVAGRAAVQLDLTTDSPCPDDRMWLWKPLPEGSDFHFNDAERVRVYAVDGGGFTVIIVIEAFPDADYEVLLQKADEVIGTMTIGPS
jgi:hypothetical protein